MEAKVEAQRVLLRRQQEANYEFIEVPDYQAPSSLSKADVVKEVQSKSGNSKKKTNKSGSDNKSSYQGRKK